MESSLLAGWDNFYVIAGAAAGGLTGLTFVLSMALLFATLPTLCPYGVAVSIMLLMIVGIHNAWDIAVWNSINRQNDESHSPKD